MSMFSSNFSAEAPPYAARLTRQKPGRSFAACALFTSFVFRAVAFGACASLSATSLAQITGRVAFNTASYNIGGSVSVSHVLETPSTIDLPLFGNDLKQTSGFATNEFDYYTFPAEIKTTVANTAMTGASKAVGNVSFDIKAETGALKSDRRWFFEREFDVKSGNC